MGSKLTVAAYYKLSHLSEKIIHQVKRKYIFEKKKKSAFEFLECRGNRKRLCSKKTGLPLKRRERAKHTIKKPMWNSECMIWEQPVNSGAGCMGQHTSSNTGLV